jgi:hypothetical protein
MIVNGALATTAVPVPTEAIAEPVAVEAAPLLPEINAFNKSYTVFPKFKFNGYETPLPTASATA